MATELSVVVKQQQSPRSSRQTQTRTVSCATSPCRRPRARTDAVLERDGRGRTERTGWEPETCRGPSSLEGPTAEISLRQLLGFFYESSLRFTLCFGCRPLNLSKCHFLQLSSVSLHPRSIGRVKLNRVTIITTFRGGDGVGGKLLYRV